MSPAVMRRRQFAGGLALAAASIAAPVLRAQGKAEKGRVVIAVAGKASFDSLPLTIAEQLGYFRAEGVDVEVVDFPVGGRALQAALTGSADVVSGAFEHTINLQGRNQVFQSFVLQGRAPQVAFGVSTRSVPNYRTLADLRGRRVGIAAPGSSSAMVANLVLARGGVKPAEVTLIGVGTGASALSALRNGQVDALSNVDPAMTMLEQKGEAKIISDTRTLKGTLELFGGPMPATCLYAPIEFVQRHPNTCQALANAIVHGLKWLQTAGPSDIIKTVPETHFLGDRALYLAAFTKVRESIALDGVLEEEAARTALRVTAGFEPWLRPERIDLAKAYTNEFARRAKAKFKA